MDRDDDSTAVAAEPIPVPEAPGEAGIGDETTQSYGVAGWTLFSRVTGLLRVAVAGAVLGSTFFANIFQATNTIPNLTFNLMAGSVLTALIIPLVVAALGVDGPIATAAARRECWILLFLVLPQIGFYGLVAVGTAAQNARGKFVLAAAAPAVENVGT